MLINFEFEKKIFFRIFYLVLILFDIKYYEGALCQFTLVIHFAIGLLCSNVGALSAELGSEVTNGAMSNCPLLTPFSGRD
jgi:hypothetical protein